LLLAVLRHGAVRFAPKERVTDCRDPKDNKYLELAWAAEAGIIVSGDADLLVWNPWRGIRILSPKDCIGLTPAP
jgi:putative PIN family toxin of toxin-antitoxin system